jgi:hypothetical protein
MGSGAAAVHAGGMNDAEVRLITATASTAPSLHGSQPWRFVVGETWIDVCRDEERWLRQMDPQQRQLHLSCGAAAELARLAIRSLGYACTVRTGPVGGDPELLVRLSVGSRQRPTARETRLMSVLSPGRDMPAPLGADPIPTAVIAMLQQAVNDRGCWLRQVAPGERAALTVLLGRAPTLGDATHVAEQEQLPAAPEPTADRPLVGGHDSIMVLGTDADTPHDWLRGGRALATLTVTLTAEGFDYRLLGPATDVSATRRALRGQFGDVGFPQQVLRVGYRSGTPLPPRRAVDDVLGAALPSIHAGAKLAP